MDLIMPGKQGHGSKRGLENVQGSGLELSW